MNDEEKLIRELVAMHNIQETLILRNKCGIY